MNMCSGGVGAIGNGNGKAMSKNSQHLVSVIIPALNPGLGFRRVIDAIMNQTRKSDEILVVDSSSDDGSLDFIRDYEGVRIVRIQRKDFDHGGTRDWALRQTSGDYVVFMTQDAIPYDETSIENLIQPLEDDVDVAAVSGRQIAYSDAKRQEKLIRQFNYPEVSMKWNRADVPRLGIRAFMISDVFAAYRRNAYLSAGGFDHPLLTNEDMFMAQKLLDAGHSICYNAEAKVYHSHDYSLRQEYERNKTIGYVLEKYKDRLAGVTEYGRGLDLVKYVSLNLLKGLHLVSFAEFGFNCVARLIGNRKGRRISEADNR